MSASGCAVCIYVLGMVTNAIGLFPHTWLCWLPAFIGSSVWLWHVTYAPCVRLSACICQGYASTCMPSSRQCRCRGHRCRCSSWKDIFRPPAKGCKTSPGCKPPHQRPHIIDAPGLWRPGARWLGCAAAAKLFVMQKRLLGLRRCHRWHLANTWPSWFIPDFPCHSATLPSTFAGQLSPPPIASRKGLRRTCPGWLPNTL